MKRIFATLIILAIATLLVACAKETVQAPSMPKAPSPPPPAPVAPTPDSVAPIDSADAGNEDVVEAKPVKGDAEMLNDGSEILKGEDTQDMGSKVEGVACDPETNKITFTVTNVGELDWALDQDAPFVSNELKNVKIFINSYEANRGTVQYHPDTREPMFGPNKLFSDNCGGVTILSPGDSVECTLYPVKLNRGTGSDGLSAVNTISVDSPSIDENIEFTC